MGVFFCVPFRFILRYSQLFFETPSFVLRGSEDSTSVLCAVDFCSGEVCFQVAGEAFARFLGFSLQNMVCVLMV